MATDAAKPSATCQRLFTTEAGNGCLQSAFGDCHGNFKWWFKFCGQGVRSSFYRWVDFETGWWKPTRAGWSAVAPRNL